MTEGEQRCNGEPDHSGNTRGKASTGTEAESDPAPNINAISERVEALSDQVKDLREQLEDEQDDRRDLKADLEEERERRRSLEEEVEDLSARTDLLRLVESSDQLTGEQRSVALVQHLRRAAERQRERGRDAKASVNRQEADRALQYPDIDRTTLYTDMQRAVRLVDDEQVLWYDSQTGGESRLKMNLDAGELPREVAGRSTNHGRR